MNALLSKADAISTKKIKNLGTSPAAFGGTGSVRSVALHLQSAAAMLGYGIGSFPKAEADCQKIITLPAHQHLTDGEINYTVEMVRKFY